MNRTEFMGRLSVLLSGLPEGERKEALQYYEDYLDDAGVENEEEVLSALGTPEELAASIREGLRGGSEQHGEYSESGFYEKREKAANEVMRREAHSQQTKSQSAGNGQMHGPNYGAHRMGDGQNDGRALDRRYRFGQKKSNSALWIALLCLFAAPVAFPLAVVALALALTAVIVVAVLGLVGVVCAAGGIAALIAAAAKLFMYPAGAVLAIGVSLMIIGFGILWTVGFGWLLMRLSVWVFRGTANGIGGLFRRRGGNAA